MPAPSEQPVVFVIDDDALVRDAIEDLLQSVGLEVRLFASPGEFLKSRRPDAPGCLVLDVRLPEQSGLDFQKALVGTDMDLPIIFITGHGDISMSVRAMKSGAVEFLTKPFRDQDFIDAIQAAIGRDRARRADARVLVELRRRFAALTPREQEVKGQVVSGRLNKQVAGDLNLSEARIKALRGQICGRCRLRSRSSTTTRWSAKTVEAGHAIPTIFITAYPDETVSGRGRRVPHVGRPRPISVERRWSGTR
jgi:FixJ family two-component response regulator